jgi:hypothetical protein
VRFEAIAKLRPDVVGDDNLKNVPRWACIRASSGGASADLASACEIVPRLGELRRVYFVVLCHEGS